MSLLPWISDNDLSACVDALIDRSNNAANKAQDRIKNNVIDPFSSLVIASTLAVETTDTLVALQEKSSALSGMASALGKFHQEILGSVPGWQDHDAGYDLESVSRQMLAEIKNKHNTMNASNRAKVESDLDTAIRQKGTGWSGYLVIIIPKRPVRYEKRLTTPRPVYEVDGASFYTKITGHNKALHDLFTVLVTMLETTTQRQVPSDIKAYCRTVLNESIPL